MIHHIPSGRTPRSDPAARPSAAHRSARSVLADLAGDVAYLELKRRIGEKLTASELATLEAARAAAVADRPIGGEP